MRPQETLVASFGGAQILKHLNGKLEIRGGSEEEKAQAHDWMRHFPHLLAPNHSQNWRLTTLPLFRVSLGYGAEGSFPSHSRMRTQAS